MTRTAMVYRRPVGVMRQSVKPQLASWDRAGHPSQVKLARFLAHVDAIAGPVLATVSGRVAAELIVGFSEGVCLIDGGHDLGNYLFPVVQRLGPQRVAAIFGRKIHGPSSLAVGPAQPDTAAAAPQFSTRMAGPDAHTQWTQNLCDRLAAQATAADPGTVGMDIALTTGHIDTDIAHDVIIHAWWSTLYLNLQTLTSVPPRPETADVRTLRASAGLCTDSHEGPDYWA